jgi:group I intron endonuclease
MNNKRNPLDKEQFSPLNVENWPSDKNGIYSIVGKYNDFNLVGQTYNKLGFKRRWEKHLKALKNGNHYNKYIQNSWNKHGIDNFEFVILETVIDNNNIDELEIKWISKLNSFHDNGNGWNLTTGGKPKCILSKQTITNHKNKIFSESHRKNLSIAQTGKKHSRESLDKMARVKATTHTLISPSGELIEIFNLEKFSKDNGLNASSMHRVSKGINYSYKGWKTVLRERKKTGITSKPVTLISPEGNITTFENRPTAQRLTGINASNMSMLINKQCKQRKGWRYYE